MRRRSWVGLSLVSPQVVWPMLQALCPQAERFQFRRHLTLPCPEAAGMAAIHYRPGVDLESEFHARGALG